MLAWPAAAAACHAAAQAASSSRRGGGELELRRSAAALPAIKLAAGRPCLGGQITSQSPSESQFPALGREVKGHSHRMFCSHVTPCGAGVYLVSLLVIRAVNMHRYQNR